MDLIAQHQLVVSPCGTSSYFPLPMELEIE